MPAKTPFVLTDGEATPVNHTFNPSAPTQTGVEPWIERATSGVTLGNSPLLISVTPPQGNSQFSRVKVKLSRPHLISTTPPGASAPVTSVDHTDTISIECTYHNKSTTQDRKNIRTMIADLLMEAQFVSIHDNLEGSW